MLRPITQLADAEMEKLLFDADAVVAPKRTVEIESQQEDAVTELIDSLRRLRRATAQKRSARAA